MRKNNILLIVVFAIFFSLLNVNSTYAYKYVCSICEKLYNASTYEEAVEKHLQDHISDNLGITCIGDLENTEAPDELFNVGDVNENRRNSILKNIGLIIFSVLLALIGSLLFGISSAAYGFLGTNDFISNFITFSLNFETINDYVSGVASNICSLLTGLAISLIVMFVLKKILLNYVLWRGNPNENPLEAIIGVALCVAMISGFSEIYAGISSILGNIVTSISGNGNINFSDIPKNMLSTAGITITNGSFDVMKEYVNDPTGLAKYAKMIAILILSLLLFIKLLQALISAAKAGLELLALKVAAPMFCLSLLNNNVSGFGSYLKEICKRFFGIMLRVAAINIALGLLSNTSGSIIFTICGAFACIAVIENAGQFLSGIVTSVGGGSEVVSVMGAGSVAASIASKNIKNRLLVKTVSLLKHSKGNEKKSKSKTSSNAGENYDYKESEYMKNMANEYLRSNSGGENIKEDKAFSYMSFKEKIQESEIQNISKLQRNSLNTKPYLQKYIKRSNRFLFSRKYKKPKYI